MTNSAAQARTHGLHPADAATLAILFVVAATLGVSAAAGRDVGGAFVGHAALLAGFAALAWWMARREGAAWVPYLRGVAVINTMFVLYTTLGHVAFRAIPWLADPALAEADRALFLGATSPAELLQHVGGGWVEGLAFFYGAFIPYLYMTVLLGLVGRPARERDEFVTGFALLYAVSFLGYLFVPARGPVVYLAGDLVPLAPGGFFHQAVLRSIEGFGGPHGAFPSLHLGASCYAAMFDLSHRNRLRGLIYVPLVLGIAAATLVLRYHYLVDLVAGVALAWGALRVSAALWGAKERRARLGGAGWAYRAVRGAWAASLGAFFRRVDVQGQDNVPAAGPTLLVANHSNAFVDGLLVLTRLPRPVSLTAKSTLRKNPLLRPLIVAMRVVELHRAQDEGADTSRNVDALAECRRRLASGGAVCIFPEGISHSDPALRPFKTGAARVALDYVAEHGSLMVVPVGIYYDAKERFRSTAGLVFGEPFDAAAWRAANPDAHPRALTEEMERRIRALTANFAGEEEAALVGRATELLEVASAPTPPIHRDEPADVATRIRTVHRLQAGRAWLSERRGAELAALEASVDGFFRKLRRLGISARELFLPMGPARAAFFVVREMETLLVGAPLALWGAINHALPYAILRKLVGKMSTDRDHFASNAVFLALPVVPLCYGLQTGAVAALAGMWMALLYALSLPLGAAVALLYRDRAGGVWQRVRTFLLFLRRPSYQRALVGEAREITARIQRLSAEFDGSHRGTETQRKEV